MSSHHGLGLAMGNCAMCSFAALHGMSRRVVLDPSSIIDYWEVLPLYPSSPARR